MTNPNIINEPRWRAATSDDGQVDKKWDWLLKIVNFERSFLAKATKAVDREIESETDRERIKGGIIKARYSKRSDWIMSGGFLLILLFAIPLGFWFGSVIIYSVFWCKGCAFPMGWHIAALPAPLDDWAGGIIIAIFGVIGVSALRR